MTEVSAFRRPALEDGIVLLLTRSLGPVAGSIRVSVTGARIILRGSIPSYAEKTCAEASLRLAGYPDVDNRLRVAPSLAARSSPSL